jgi:threonylcarbamoyladenosine tRNA methylthiotransferase MtaB
MERKYTTGDYEKAVRLIRSVVPDAAITTDVIVGFPGESEEEFQESYEFCRRIGFARIHVFSYSKRRGTAAATMPDQVPDGVKKERSRQVLALARESARSFHQRFVGKTMTVLWEQESNGVWSGLTGNYIKMYTKSDADLANKLMPVKLVKLWRDGVWGEAS